MVDMTVGTGGFLVVPGTEDGTERGDQNWYWSAKTLQVGEGVQVGSSRWQVL